jgi:hypothetical protein
LSRRNLAKHLTHENRAVEARGDFGMAAADRDAQLVTGCAHVGHDALGQLGRGTAFWKKQNDEEPHGARSQHGDIVRVDVDRVPPDVIGGERDRVGRDDEIPIAGVDDGRVLANLRPNEETGIASGKTGQQWAQMLDREFAGGQNPVRLAARH